ncbi:MAG: DUF6599 family protein [Dissulfurispiraceae bacterium]|jgi:hypothetical protein
MNSVPFIYRLILVGLLPFIAAVIYVRGQSYDPALIDFKTANGGVPEKSLSVTTPQPMEKAVSPPAAKDIPVPKSLRLSGVPEITGFLVLGEERHYTKENLYEHVDGHAEYFIGAGFAGLTVTEYVSAGSKAAQAEIEVEVYDMGKGIQAFGVLTDESGENPQAVSVGAMGYKTSGGVNFIKGRYYVKISSFNPKAPILKFARGFSETIPSGPPGQDSFSKVFSQFPDLGKVEKTRFVKEGYRGLDFFRNVIEREYLTGGKKITVALMTGNSQEMKSLKSSFMDYFRKSGIRYEKVEEDGSEVYKVSDKYEGNWFLIPAGNTIFSVFGTDDEGILKHFARNKR